MFEPFKETEWLVGYKSYWYNFKNGLGLIVYEDHLTKERGLYFTLPIYFEPGEEQWSSSDSTCPYEHINRQFVRLPIECVDELMIYMGSLTDWRKPIKKTFFEKIVSFFKGE